MGRETGIWHSPANVILIPSDGETSRAEGVEEGGSSLSLLPFLVADLCICRVPGWIQLWQCKKISFFHNSFTS